MEDKDLLRFWKKVRILPNDCWEWQAGKVNGGYGRFSTTVNKKSKLWLAHRYAYEKFVGVIPDDLQLHHMCENPWCVNPDHLLPVTPAYHTLCLTVNATGSVNSRKTHCVRGHPLTEKDTRSAAKGKNWRFCRICNKERCKENYWKDPEKQRASAKQRYRKRKGQS